MPSRGAQTLRYQVYRRGEWITTAEPVVEESLISVFVNGSELITMMATPRQQEYLAAGFLFSEGLISGREDILSVSLAPNESCVDVWVRDDQLILPDRRVLTTGCGRGTTFDRADHLPPLDSDLHISPSQLSELMRELQERAELYHRARGIHAAGLATPAGIVIMTEDMGRHNTLDKLAGWCLLEGISPADHILIATGRLSSEMMTKARRMSVPLVASRSSPTTLSVQRAEQWHITVVGYLRPGRMRVYTHPERVIQEDHSASPTLH